MKRNAPPVEDCGCCDCPPCSAPTFLCTYTTGTAYNCGLAEYDPSTPPRFYGKQRESATISKSREGTKTYAQLDGICCITETWSGSGSSDGYIDTTINRPVSAPGPFGCESTSTDTPPDWEYTEGTSYAFSGSPDCPGSGCGDFDYSDPPSTTTYGWGGSIGGYTETIISPTEKHLDKVVSSPVDTEPTPSGSCGCNAEEHSTDVYEEHRVFTLSDEITEDTIRDDAISLMDPLGDLTSSCDFSSGSIIASLAYSEDRKTCYVKSGKYGFRHFVPAAVPFRCGGAAGGGSPACFRITWDRIFTPVEGDPVTTPMSYTWDGTIPEGYDVADQTTWPKVEHTEDVPTEEGTVTLANLVFHCTGC